MSLHTHADEIDEAMGGFDDTSVTVTQEKSVEDALLDGFDDTSVTSVDIKRVKTMNYLMALKRLLLRVV